MRLLTSLALALSSALLFTACSSGVKLDDKVPVEERQTTLPKDGQGPGAGVENRGLDPLNDPKNILSQRSIYFDLDSYIVRNDFKPVIEAHARYLNANKSRKVIIQGNTDERGGSEYNLALGQKRAEAVRKALALLGVQESQMEAVSLGKEKPKAQGSDEAAWAENRRADLVYQ